MDISLYIIMEVICFISLGIMLFQEDRELQIVFSIVSFILFAAAAINAFGIELNTYNGGWQNLAFVDLTFGLVNFLFVVISGLTGFGLIMNRSKDYITGTVNNGKHD